MKKKVTAFAIFASTFAFSQVGIGTNSPHSSSILDLTATDKAMVVTRVANTAAVPSPINGMIIYDLSSNCFKGYQNGAWTSCGFIESNSTNSVLAQVGNEGDSPNVVPSVVTSAQLASVPGVTGVVPANQTAYQAYIDANPSLFSSPATVAEVNAMIAAVNASQTVLAQIGNEGDAPDTVNSVVTVAQINTISPAITGAILANETAYQDYIDANPSLFSSPATAAEVQAMINAVNAAISVLAQVGNEGDSPNTVPSVVTTTQLASVPGVTGVVPANQAAYQAYIDANPSLFSSPATVAEVNAMIASVNAVITIPATITLAQNRTYIVASVFDQDYLPYTAPTGAATTNTQAANGVNEAVTVNVQGTITTAGVTIKIPVTATGSNTLPAYSTTITIPASMTQDGTSRDLTLSWAAQAYTSGTTSINATIAAVGGTLNAKKLDINAGTGNDALGVLMGQFTYPYNNAGNTTTYSVRDIAGIPDKMFGLPDNNSNSTTHMMLYLPMVAADGNIWLNNNLGAHYANINHASFNPAQQATGATDHLAYGSLFQWGRKPDGHELITYTNGTTGTSPNGTTATRPNADTAANALFITINSGNYDWRGTTQNDALWATEASANNPCPVGFRVPTNAELTTLVTSSSITNSATAASSAMKFTVPGFRSSSNGSLYVGSFGYYWSSSVNGSYAWYSLFTSGGTNTSDLSRALGFSVRCLKD